MQRKLLLCRSHPCHVHKRSSGTKHVAKWVRLERSLLENKCSIYRYGYPVEETMAMVENTQELGCGGGVGRCVPSLKGARPICRSQEATDLSSIPSVPLACVSPAIAWSPSFAYAPSGRAGRLGHGRIETDTKEVGTRSSLLVYSFIHLLLFLGLFTVLL